MTRAIRSIITELDELHSVFGFGSFFRGEKYRDLDVLVVLKPTADALLDNYYAIRARFDILGRALGITFDLLVLTLAEFEERPLREMNSLAEIYRAQTTLEN